MIDFNDIVGFIMDRWEGVEASFAIYKGKKGYFNISPFPEIIHLIKKDCKR